MSEIQELKAECAGYRARLEKIKLATNHVTPEEKEKVGIAFIQKIILETLWKYCCGFLFTICCTVSCNVLIHRFTKSGGYT